MRLFKALKELAFLRGRELGASAEIEAARYLSSHGFKIIEKNFSSKTGEIDIIARDGESIVFIEVKARSSEKKGSASSAVTPMKQKKIIMTALYYLKSKGLSGSKARFDVVAVDSSGSGFIIEHIRNAFESKSF